MRQSSGALPCCQCYASGSRKGLPSALQAHLDVALLLSGKIGCQKEPDSS